MARRPAGDVAAGVYVRDLLVAYERKHRERWAPHGRTIGECVQAVEASDIEVAEDYLAFVESSVMGTVSGRFDLHGGRRFLLSGDRLVEFDEQEVPRGE
ncbi:hypothetical protein [Gordonia sp. NPDC003422]